MDQRSFRLHVEASTEVNIIENCLRNVENIWDPNLVDVEKIMIF